MRIDMYIYIRMYNVLFSEYDIYNNLKASSLARLSVLCMICVDA